jgi:EpsI family protein
MLDDGRFRRPLTAAAAACVFMFATGWGYRVLAARLAAPVDAEPISAAAVGRFPMQIGAWTGQEKPIDPNLVARTDTDAHISRVYSRGGVETVSLWVACGVRTRDLMPHRPEVCYTGSGWTLREQKAVDLPTANGGTLPCNLMRFSRGTLGMQNTMVLYYYIVDGKYCRDVSEWRYSLKPIGYVAQVQVVGPVPAGQTMDSVERLVSAFAVDSAASLVGLFDDVQETADPAETHGPIEGER